MPANRGEAHPGHSPRSVADGPALRMWKARTRAAPLGREHRPVQGTEQAAGSLPTSQRALTSTTTCGTSGASAAVAAAASARAAAASAASAAAAASVSTDSARSWDSKRTSSATSGLTRRSSSRVTSYKSARAMRFPISGADSARSHLETAWRDSPSCSASPSWENPRSRRNSARRWAISTFITVPFRVLFVTSRLSPYGFNPGCTSTLCGQFTRNEQKIPDNHRLPHPRTGNLRSLQRIIRPICAPFAMQVINAIGHNGYSSRSSMRQPSVWASR